MSLFAMTCSCNMLFDGSKHCHLMLFLQSLKLLLYAILPCVLEHDLLISRDSLVFMFCYALPVLHAHAFCYYFGVLYLIVLMLVICLLAVMDRLLLWRIVRVCCTVAPFWVCSIWSLLDFACSFILSCCFLDMRCLLDVCMHFASMPCLSCFAHIF